MESSKQPDSEPRGPGDRRQLDRRRLDRRTPVPPWRRPWAFLLYGVLLAISVVAVSALLRGDDDPTAGVPRNELAGTPQGVPGPPPPPGGVAEDARRHADFERLVAEGGEARGRLVTVELYCASISSVSTRTIPEGEEALRPLVDSDGRLPAAECKWGPSMEEVRREDLILVVPPYFAELFTQAPTVEDGFVRRRYVVADIEWVGRSEAIALRTVGILRRYPAAAP